MEALTEEIGAGSTGPVLEAAEIDTLLGFAREAAVGDPSGSSAGVQQLVEAGLVNFERLPMLEVVFDRMVRILSTSLRNFTSDNVEVSIDNVLSLRFGDYLHSVPMPAMLAVFKAEDWDNYGLMVIDSDMIYSTVDALLGGSRGAAPSRMEPRPYTTIERTLAERLINLVLADLSTAFEPICAASFRFERLEVNPRFAMISRPGNAALLGRLRVAMEDRGGTIDLLLPYATLEPVRELLLQRFMGEKFGRDTIWEQHLVETLATSEITLDVVLDEVRLPLSAVRDLRPGARIALNAPAGAPVEIRCGGAPLYRARAGRRGGHVAVRLEQALPRAMADR